MSPVAVASRAAFDVFLIDEYRGTLGAYLRTLMLYLKQGSFTRDTAWLPVLSSWTHQTAPVGVKAGCAKWGSDYATSTGGTLAGKMGWWRQAAEKLSGCLAGPSGEALFAFQSSGSDLDRPTQTFASLANCKVMQDQAAQLFGMAQ